MKKLLSVLSSTLQGRVRGGLLILALLATSTLWAHDFEVNGIYYNYLDSNNVEVTYRGDCTICHDNEYSGSVTIPETVTHDGTTYRVTSIGGTAFAGCSDLKSVTIGNSVTSIGSAVFQECYSLSSVTIPNSVTSIGESAFSFCSALTSLTIPNSVTNIGDRAFTFCSALISLKIPNSVTNIGHQALSNCSALTSVIIGNSVTSIDSWAFYDCSSLESITIPNSVTSIGDMAFYNCSGLTLVTIGDGLTSIGDDAFYGCSSLTSVSIGNSVTSIGEYAFFNCSSLNSITIPNSVTSIGEYAFYKCSGLTLVTIGDGLTSIGAKAFDYCKNIEEIYCYPITPPAIESSSFYNYSKATLYVPCDSKEVYEQHPIFGKFEKIKGIEGCGEYVTTHIYDTICQGDVYEFGEYLCDATGTYTAFIDLVPTYLHLTVLPRIIDTITIQVCDSYEWRGKVYTESGVYTYEEWCYQEILELTIIPSEDKEYVYEHHNYLVCDADIFVDPITGSTHVIRSLIPFSLTWSDTIIGTNIDTIHTFNITPIVYPEPLTEDMLYAIGAVPKLVAGEKVDLMGTTELIMAYYQMHDQHDIADVIGVEWVAGHDVVLDAEQTTHTMELEVWDECDDIIPMEFTFPVSKKDSEPQDTIIYIDHPTEYATICEGEKYTWMGVDFTAAGMFISEEIVEDENYIYHHIYTLELTVIPFSSDTIVVEAYDSYEWHGKVYTESGTYIYEIYENFCSIEVLELTIIDTPTPPESEIPTEGIGVFSVGEGKTVTFSRGNLQYTQSTDTWSFAENQWDMIGTDNVTGGSVESNQYGAYYKQGDALADKIDLFCWSASNTTAPFGVSTSADYNDYSGSFVDWGTNQIGADAPNTWRTLTYDEWDYLRHTRTNANALCGIAQVNGVNGFILLPDSWACPDGVTFKSGFHSHSDYSVKAYGQYQTFTADQWSKLEKSGAVFLPVAGDRLGTCVYDVQNHGYYWSATEDGSDLAYYFGFYSVGAYMGYGSRNGGYSVRLVKDVNSTTPEPPVEPETEEIFIYQPVDAVTICASELPYIWTESGMRYTEAGTYTYEEIVEDENYIYHYIFTLELTVLRDDPVEYDAEKVIICASELPYFWVVDGEYGQYWVECETAGTYEYIESLECGMAIYTLELEVLEEGIVDTIWVEAYDSYEWHGKIYTESGQYQYYNECSSVEVLNLTIIDTPTPPEPEIPTEGIGVFSIGEGKTVTFSQGNLQYTQSTDTWSFAENQYDYIGTDNVTGDSVSSSPTLGDSKSGALSDKVDLFGWSTSATNFGVSTSTDWENDYLGSFVDWGTNQIDADAPNTWRTLSYDEWNYLRWERPNYSDLCGVAQVNGVNGLIFLPDNWTCPSGVTFKSGFHSEWGVDYYAAYQTFTAAEWSKLEAAGAVFLPASGYRYGYGVYVVQNYGAYWSATEYNSDSADILDFHSDGAGMRFNRRNYGYSVRLVKDISNTTPEPPVEPEGPCSNIQELDWKNGLRLSDFSAKTWYKMYVGDVKGSNFEVRWINDEPCVATWTTAYLSECLNTTDWSEIEWESLVTITEILDLDTTCTVSSSFFDNYSQIGDYIYVYVGSKVLDCDSEPQDTTIYHPTEYVAICEGDEFYWRGRQITEAGTHTDHEIVEDENYTYHHIYTLELSLLLSGEIIAFPTTEVTICENELPYVWNINRHEWEVVGAGTYTQEEILDCGGAIYTLELTVIPSEKVVLVEEAYDSYEWHGNVYTESGVYTYQDPYYPCVIEELHLTIIETPTIPTELQDTIYYADAICAGETYIWWGMEFTETGTYTYIYEEIVEDEDYIYIYRHLHILYLTVLPYETIEYEVEAYDSYVWYGEVYTESGVYTYRDPYNCVIEELHLTIIPSEDNQGEVVVEPSTNSVTITWQKEDDADTYIIVIKQGDKVVCTLIFDTEGNLVSVNYLPGRESNKHGIQHAGLTSDSFQYTITGLTPSTDYTYTVTATDDSDNTISSYSGEFTTHHATSVENTNSPSPTIDCQKILYKDHIYILRDGKTYTIMGQEI